MQTDFISGAGWLVGWIGRCSMIRGGFMGHPAPFHFVLAAHFAIEAG